VVKLLIQLEKEPSGGPRVQAPRRTESKTSSEVVEVELEVEDVAESLMG
jgi:hypothetical protein